MDYILSSEDKTAFEADGVICLRGVLTEEEIDGLRKGVDTQLANRHVSPTAYDFESIGEDVWDAHQAVRVGAATRFDMKRMKENIRSDPTAKPLREKDAKGGMFFYDVAGWKTDRGIRRAALDSKLPEIIFQLLSTGYVNFWEDTTFVKTPGTAQCTAYHQDLAYFQIEGAKCAIVWIALDPADRTNGGVRYIRGSHKWGKVYAPNVFVAQTPSLDAPDDRLPDIEGNIEDYDIVDFEVQPGDVIIHDVRTVHGAGGNPSNCMRRAISFRYCGDDIRYLDRAGATPQVNMTHDLQDGDRLFCRDFPLVYPTLWPGIKLSDLYQGDAT